MRRRRGSAGRSVESAITDELEMSVSIEGEGVRKSTEIGSAEASRGVSTLEPGGESGPPQLGSWEVDDEQVVHMARQVGPRRIPVGHEV